MKAFIVAALVFVGAGVALPAAQSGDDRRVHEEFTGAASSTSERTAAGESS